MNIPVYLVNGFLEAGKTAFVKYTAEQPYFNDGTDTLLLLCEEGVEEISEAEKKAFNMTIEVIEDEKSFTKELLDGFVKKYNPSRVMIEFNGMWDVEDLLDQELPSDWFLGQIITLIDASTFGMYLTNMKPLVMKMVSNSDMIIFNRCDADTDLATYKRSIKVINKSAILIFEKRNGEIAEVVDEPPYDLSADIVEIEDEDFGIFYVDALEKEEDYRGKTVQFKGKVLKDRNFPSKYFVPGRMAMTCCADDISFVGFLCNSKFATKLEQGQWVLVTAKVAYEHMAAYDGKGPVLYASHVEITEEPEEELVYF